MRKKYIVTNPPTGSDIHVDEINLPIGESQEFDIIQARHLLRVYEFLSLDETQSEDFHNDVDFLQDTPDVSHETTEHSEQHSDDEVQVEEPSQEPSQEPAPEETQASQSIQEEPAVVPSGN